MSKKDRFKLVGNTIAGTFRVDEVVAEGGFGVVYRAFHLHFRSPVALKCLKIPSELSDAERKTFLEQFRSEAEIQFRLSAALPNIVRPLHVDAVRTDSGEFVPLMALEWLDGKSLEKLIEERSCDNLLPLTLSEAMDLVGPAAQALNEAHHFESDGEQISVIHRDIKPDNLFVTEISGRKTVKILDFGISKVRRTASQLAGKLSQTGEPAPFSPAYGAPEQWVPKRFGQTGPWTDIWGLALTLVEMIKGEAVIVGDHQAMMGTSLDPKVRPTPRNEGVQVSDEVEMVFQKALALDPRYRYQSILDFWEALGAAATLGGLRAGGVIHPSVSRVVLPKMSAPTPWTPAHLKLRISSEDVGHLPPMLAPAPIVPTLACPAPGASYPSNPNSDLKPVQPAPTQFNQIDALEIPPIFEKPQSGLALNPMHSQLPHADELSGRVEHKSLIPLELMPTSTFPSERTDLTARHIAAKHIPHEKAQIKAQPAALLRPPPPSLRKSQALGPPPPPSRRHLGAAAKAAPPLAPGARPQPIPDLELPQAKPGEHNAHKTKKPLKPEN